MILHSLEGRFTGSVEWLAAVYVDEIADWIAAIPFTEWPQQKRPGELPLKPSMVTDPGWHGFGEQASPIVSQVLSLFPGCKVFQIYLSVVMPGDGIDPHTDSQPPYWLCRVHVPLLSNLQSKFLVGGRAHQMAVGSAYRVNTEAVHSVVNPGETPRIHLMFDINKIT